MKFVLFLIALALPFVMPYITRFLEELVEVKTIPPKENNTEKTVSEALNILGLGQNPSPEQVREAHKRMISKNHPDMGGSIYIASKINWARDELLKRAA